ncbi:3-dehydroquinate synthase [Frankia sp. AiPs1]|uniref:3-dehydroquinate synthase n=1 Tax=Frankia sp. AiPa1 TaxID=573492 RepID=UPI00202AF6A8|nr:3-dehydroquinate synthase [Frankia sp. AiPa1]MCL9760273.1 3-dehydroquinate synthase [Frankia sp. AiPa1]
MRPTGSVADVVRIPVRPQGERPYDVVLGDGVLSGLAETITGRTRAVVIHPVALRATAAALVADLRAGAGVEAHTVEVPDGERAKRLQVAGDCWDVLGRIGATRDDVVIGLGGGTVTDLAGFVAASWLRGVDVVQVPTTVLGMVDAAVGGKTGIDVEAGKNLVGAFHQPLTVLCDLAMLASLPAVEVRAGLAEVVKTGFIADGTILDLLEDDPSGAAHLPELIERSIRVKADVVSGDPREAGRREVLNYGHTLGHAIEKVEGFTWRHGAAISVGMVFAAELSRLAVGLDKATAERHRRLLARIGLPVSYQHDRWPLLLDAMRVDKKSRGRRLRFIALTGQGDTVIVDDPDADLLVAAYRSVAR